MDRIMFALLALYLVVTLISAAVLAIWNTIKYVEQILGSHRRTNDSQNKTIAILHERITRLENR